MLKGQQAHYTSALIPLSAACSDCLNRAAADEHDLHRDGAFSKDGTCAWLHTGRYLEVFSTQGGQRIAAWCFGSALRDPSTLVTCCVEWSTGSAPKFLVGTESTSACMLVVFDARASRVSKAVQIPDQVTSIEVVSSVGADQSAEHILSPHLQHFSGIVAIGTRRGHIYLIDLNLDDEEERSDEVRPASLRFLNPRVRDTASERYNAMAAGEHLCLQLGEDANRRGYFYYKKPDDQTIKYFSSDEVSISKMKFIGQTGQLAVGFSFGCFQLWRLSIPVLEYSSRYEDDLAAVTHFAFQEPENDPRNFCYLWVARGPQPCEQQVDYNSVVSLYQLGYNKKLWYDGFGYHFEELTSVGPRFEHELTTDPYNVTEGSPGSRLVACCTLEDPKYRLTDRDADLDSFEEGSGGPDLSLCVMVWEAGYTSPDPEPSCHLALFDMNRWYHAQMPYQIRAFAGSHEACPFFAFYSLKDVLKACDPGGLLGVHVPFSSLSRFHSVSIPAPEQHFYPSSMSFDTCFLAENGMVQSKYLGTQRQFLAQLQEVGADCLVEPTHVYSTCLYAGLLPRHTDASSLQVHKREAILSSALDYGLMPFIHQCITRFASGEFISRGLNLRFLVDWAWKRVAHVKDSGDKLCVPLYDWSGVQLDEQTLQLLHQLHTALDRLSAIFALLVAQPSSDVGKQDLETKLSVCTLIRQHVQIVLWFYSVDLLPEHAEEESNGLMQYSYPGKVLRDSYRARRLDIEKLHSELKSSDVLHIDGLIEHIGQPLKVLLEKEGAMGEYPFPNFHCLLTMYLLEGVPVHLKHTLVFYTLCDLYALVPEDAQQEFNDKMQQFTQAFAISTSMQKFVHAIWLLDHKDFEDALVYLLEPSMDSALAPWQHTLTIKALLYQRQPRLALRYVRVRKPALLTPEDVKLRLTVLLANGLTSEAFEYQRLCRDQLSADDLLSHLFVGSQQTKTVDQLLQLPFTEEEEAHLVAYLRTSKQLQAQELLVMYYLQRSRFIEAIRLNTKIRQSFIGDMESASRERAVTRHSLVDGYQRVLPHVQRKLAFGAEESVQKRPRTRKEFTRPTPLSMTVNRRAHERTVTRATLLRAVLDKAREVRREEAEQEGAELQGAELELPTCSSQEEAENPGPFICAPLTPKPSRAPAQRLGEVVFPPTCTLHVKAGTGTPSGAGPALSPHRGRLLTSSPLQSSMLSDTFNKPKRRLTNAADLTLLQTPPVRRKTPRRKPPTPDLPTPGTPHSILKVRGKPLRRSPSPLIFSQASRIDAELVLPSPPAFRTRFTSLAATKPDAPLPASPLAFPPAADTPKFLRFSVPPSEDSRASEGSGPAAAEGQGGGPVGEEGQGEGSEPEPSGSEMSEETTGPGEREGTPPLPMDGWRLTPEREETPPPQGQGISEQDGPHFYQVSNSMNELQQTKHSMVATQMETDVHARPGNDGSPGSGSSDHSPLQRRSIKDRSPASERASSCSPSTARQDTIRVDDDVTFNFTKPDDYVDIEMEDADTEPVCGEAAAPCTVTGDHLSQEGPRLSPDESSRDSDHVVCVDDDDGVCQTRESMDTQREHSGQTGEIQMQVLTGNEAEAVEDQSEATEQESEASRMRFASFGSSLQVEVGITKIDETSVTMKRSPGKIPAEKLMAVTDSSESSQTGSEIPEPISEQRESESVDIETVVENENKAGLFENKDKNERLSVDSEENLKLELEDEDIDVCNEAEERVVVNSRKDQVSDVCNDTYRVSPSQQVAQDPGEDSPDTGIVQSAQNTNINNTATSRVQLCDVSVVISPATVRRAEDSLLSARARESRSESHTQSEASSLTFVTSVSHSESSVTQLSSRDQSEGSPVNNQSKEPLRDIPKASPEISGEPAPSTVQEPLPSPAKECTKERADSSDDQNIISEVTVTEPATPPRSHVTAAKKTPTRTPTRKAKQASEAPRTPTRKSGRIQGVPAAEVKADVLTPRRSGRRQTAGVEEVPPAAAQGSNFKTPPHPTRMVLPPTPPESSPASTTSSAEPNDSASPGRSRARHTLGAPKRGRKTKARSRSSSPPVVSSTTEDIPVENGVDAQTADDTKMAVVEEGETLSQKEDKPKRRSREVTAPLSEGSFMMNLRSGRRLSQSRDVSPRSRDSSHDATPVSRDTSPAARPCQPEGQDMEFTFSHPHKVHEFDGNITPTPTALTASFVFSPPLTRAKTRRLSITPAASPRSSLIGLLPSDVSEQQAAAPVQAASPAKKARGRTKKSAKTVTAPTDSPINFIPEPEAVEIEQNKALRKTRMTLRTRTQPPPLLQRTRVRSLKK